MDLIKGKLGQPLISCIIVLLAFFQEDVSSFFTEITSYLKAGEHRSKNEVGDYLAMPSPHPALSTTLYRLAQNGYHQLSAAQQLSSPLLTIVDFSKPSSEKRLFIINMATQQVLVHTLVAHGQNSGGQMATRFSNKDATHQSSLGFYITGNTYYGRNGYSMKLKGMEQGINDKAENRAIVMHGAPYVSEEVIRNTGRLGRSWGCPAVSQKEHRQIIDLVKNGTCLFIYAPDPVYLAQSDFLQGIDAVSAF